MMLRVPSLREIILSSRSSSAYKSLMFVITQVAGVMDQFERQFEHLDVQTSTMDDAMSGVTTLTTPEVRPQELLFDLFAL